ncbi:MAG: IclR family transcriptional regulator C-terminal domain-containing protein [Devosia sp.]
MEAHARGSREIDASDREVVAGLVHGIAVIQALQKRSGMTQSELSGTTGLTRATARRSLITLTMLGYVDSTDGAYSLTPKVIEFATGYLNSTHGWIPTASPFLELLRNRVEENVSAVVLDRTDVVYVASFAADTVMSLNVRIGGRKPAYCTAMGRVLLAAMPDDCVQGVLEMSNIQKKTDKTEVSMEGLLAEVRKVREQGYAVIDQELEPGLIAVAVPLRNLRGEVVAAINICGHTMQTSADKLLTTCLTEALKTARQIGARIP